MLTCGGLVYVGEYTEVRECNRAQTREPKVNFSVKAASLTDENGVVNTVVAAFLTDPPARWLFPAVHQYLATMPGVVGAFAGAALANESAYYVDAYAGVALWLPPGIQPDEDALTSLFRRNLREDRLETAFALFDQMGKYHPEEPHWYLPFIAVDPIHQGRGYGSALMKHALQRCDREQKLAYLESSNPRNLSLYIRHGFKIIATITMADSPPLIPMLRKPGGTR
jgi:ribosomal protein S18 acetylase RimI-like enzyme